MGEHKFWNNEKIVNPLNKVEKEGIIEKIVQKDYVETTPIALPDGFEWAEVDAANDEHMQEITDFLNHNYVESETNDFRLA